MSKRVPLVQVAVAVIERNGCYLVSRRRPADHLGGCWEFPGGKRRVGESWHACLRRELREELGISVKLVRRLQSLRFRYPDRRVWLEVFRCTVASGEPKPLGCQEVRWLTPRQLQRRRFPPADRPLVAWLAHGGQLQLSTNTRRDIIRMRTRRDVG